MTEEYNVLLQGLFPVLGCKEDLTYRTSAFPFFFV